MNEETWRRIKDAYSAAVELSPEESEQLIEESCGDDPVVRDEALQMLRAAALPHFLDQPVVRIHWPNLPAPILQLTPGTIIGNRFRIDQMVAEGGMGSVYRATDVELNRIVALKTVRHANFATEGSLVQIRQEAQVISKLTHPAICTLHDAGHHEGLDYLVMEFLDGETLASRITRRPLTLSESIRIALDLLTALDFAHRRGIIHRDLKPTNVMLTKNGTKLLDFGIAKLTAGQNPTETLNAGTPPYMAPEQLRQGISDIRTDIFSFGILFCALLGGPGGDAADVAGALNRIPQTLKQIASKCLAEDPADRWQDAGDLRTAIEVASLQPLEVDAERKRSMRLVAVTLALILTIVAGALWVGWDGVSPAAVSKIEFEIVPPGGRQFLSIERAGPPVVSPDGTSILFVVQDQNGSMLWLRRMDSAVFTPLPGTEGATHPFWSPNSREIGFFSRNKLLIIELGSNTPRFVCDSGEGRGGTWSREGVIVFSPGYTDPLLRVSSAGGKPVAITKLDTAKQENSHRWPAFLPDGRHVLFVIRSTDAGHRGLYSVAIDGGEVQRISDIRSSALYSPNGAMGHLLYVQEAKLHAQSFDVSSLTLTGKPFVIADFGSADVSTTRAPLSVSDSGILVHGGGEISKSRLVWYDGEGKELPGKQEIYPWRTRFLRLSPDSRTVAIENLDFGLGSGSIWLSRSEHDTRPLTTAPLSAFSPVWSPNGQNIGFSVDHGDSFDLVSSSIDGVSSKLLLSSPSMVVATDWSNDGSFLFETQKTPEIWESRRLSVGEPNPKVLQESGFHEHYARISPDRRWLAYTAVRNATEDVYIRPLGEIGPTIQVSLSGGSQPVWSGNSSEVFFLDNNRVLTRSHINFGSRRVESVKQLFRLPSVQFPGRATGWEYDVSRDGKFIVATLPDSIHETRPATVVQGWQLRLK